MRYALIFKHPEAVSLIGAYLTKEEATRAFRFSALCGWEE